METKHEMTHSVVLTCWKDIAHYLGKGVRTVQRGEQNFGLPVRRPLGARHKTSVVAHPHDLDTWLKERWFNRANRNQFGPLQTQNHPACSLSTRIRASQELRVANQALVHDISAALQTLIQNCDQLAGIREEYSWVDGQRPSDHSRISLD